MMIDLRLPQITSGKPSEQLSQLQSYIYQLVEQLNWALNNIDFSNTENNESIVMQKESSTTKTESDPVDTFNSIKALIIKSADIVNAYYDKMKLSFDGSYVAQSDFGTYKEDTKQDIEANSKFIQQNFEMIESVQGSVNVLKNINSYIRSGLLSYGSGTQNPEYGIEIGQKTNIDGTEKFNRYAKFVSSGIYFYAPGNNDPVAYLTGQKLFITNANITNSINIGKYTIDISDGLAFKWVG